VKRDLGALTAREHDLLVVGGGITGAAAAWDAAQRGLSVALVEAEDFGAGASWNSLKTIHGGLRHLQRADVSGLRESVRERGALLRIAPALVRPLPFLLPTYGHGPKGREALAVAMWLNDCLGWDRNRGLDPSQRIAPGRSLSRRQVLELVPGIAQAGLSGGAVWTDAQVSSSERLVVAFVHAAASAGAAVANHLAVTGVLRKDATILGVRARDGEAGGELDVRARMVLNAAGPATDRILQLVGLTRRPVPLLRAVNLVLARPVVTTHAVGASSGGRFLFLVPWADRAIVGTAYEPAERPEADDEMARFLEDAARAYPWADLRPADVTLVHRGNVPGVGGASGLWTRSRVIDHAQADGVGGLLTLLAVKYTTARGTAEQAVDRAVRRLARRVAPCRTAETLLAAARPLEGPLAQRAIHAVRDEMARTLADAVLRRLDLGTAGRPAEADVETVCRAMAGERGWSPGRVASEREALARAFA
jgi:glycerol-3-phosphate dehydrogenase